MLEYIILVLILVLAASIVWGLIGKVVSTVTTLLINSIAGILILLFLNLYLGWNIPLTLPILLVCGLFGIPGVLTLILLFLFKML
jgi:hypothetical protein